jgi:hypothetical protein
LTSRFCRLRRNSSKWNQVELDIAAVIQKNNILDGLVVGQDVEELGDGVRGKHVLFGRVEVSLEQLETEYDECHSCVSTARKDILPTNKLTSISHVLSPAA